MHLYRGMRSMDIIAWQRIAKPDEQQARCFEYTTGIRIYGAPIELKQQGFAICYRGNFHVFRNACPHAGSPLDWNPGEFFSPDGHELVCHTHHARFDPASGACLGGPCPHGLEPLPFHDEGDDLRVPKAIH